MELLVVIGALLIGSMKSKQMKKTGIYQRQEKLKDKQERKCNHYILLDSSASNIYSHINTKYGFNQKI